MTVQKSNEQISATLKSPIVLQCQVETQTLLKLSNLHEKASHLLKLHRHHQQRPRDDLWISRIFIPI